MLSQRFSRRLLRHHLPIGLVTLAVSALLYATRPYDDIITRVSFSSAYPALFLLAATLMLGPWKILGGARVAASIDLRRDLGIWAGIMSLVHVVAGQCEHLRGRPWLYYIYENWQEEHALPFRHDLFGVANYSGLIAGFVVLALLATSNDASLRKLGTPGWKQLQRWNYAAFVLTALHTWLYQLGVKGPQWGWITLASSAIGITALLQWTGYRRRAALRL